MVRRINGNNDWFFMDNDRCVIIALNDKETFLRKFINSGTEKARPANAFDLRDFKQYDNWEVWQNEATLYYRGKVIELSSSCSGEYVTLAVIGEPQWMPDIQKYSNKELLDELERRLDVKRD